jgi:ABC-type sugar transport system ATPase subunit
MSEYILEMKNITKSFGGVKALKNVSINLKNNEILAIVGENGAGKSTLMKILSGSYHHSTYEGTIVVDGKEHVFAYPSDAEKAGIEMIYQEISMHLDLSIAENIFLGHIPSRGGIVKWKGIYEKAKAFTDMVGLNVSVRQTLRNLSTSQQQLVAIARALSRSPKILVLDEPTSALTEREVEMLFDNLVKLKEKGISSIYISHKMKEVMYLADRITVLRDGEHVSTRIKTETDVTKTVEEMVNRKITNMYPKVDVPIGEEVFRVENLCIPHPYTSRKMIVEDVSFGVRAGEILGLVGLVGAGRSETVNAIFGAIKKQSGKIYLNGREAKINTPKQAVKAGIALLTEDRKRDGYVAAMNVSQNCSLASIRQISKNGLLNYGEEKIKSKEYIDKLSIKVRNEKDSIMNLSGGNQQKVVLAKWLMTKPKVLLLDEPTRGIDVGAKTQIYEIMCQLAAQGIAIIVISSELPELIGMCDRFLVLSGGRIRMEYSREEADEEKFLKSAVES